MSQPKDITSTERLLDLIRKKKDSAPATAVQDRSAPSSPSQAGSHNLLPFQKTITIGVDIRQEDLRLVMTEKSENKWKVLSLKRVPIRQDLQRDSSDFIHFLRTALSLFLGRSKRSEIWVTNFDTPVEIRHLRIPKVPKKQIEDVVFWSTKKEFPFDEKESILDFEILGEIMDQGITKLSVMVYIAPKKAVENLKNIFSRAGYPLAGISTIPFANQNLFRTGWINVSKERVACLYIDVNASRIDIYDKGNLSMTRDVRTGEFSVMESFAELYNEKVLPTLSSSQGGIDVHEARRIVEGLGDDSSGLTETDKGSSPRKEELLDILLQALERLVRQVERTFEYYTGTLGYERVNKIYLSGAIPVLPPLLAYLNTQLGIPAEPLDPLGEQMPSLHYREIKQVPSTAERIAYTPSFGLALSDNTHTPNLLFTFRDKANAASVIRINKTIFMVFIFIVCACSVLFFYQQIAINKKKASLAALDQQLSQFTPQVSKDLILDTATKASQRQTSVKAVRNRYLGMAILSELSAMTLPNIQFIQLKLNLAPVKTENNPKAAEDPSRKESKPPEENVEIEGLITGERSVLETTLAGYAMALKSSPIFKQVVVQKNRVEQTKNGEVLHFVIVMKVG